MIPMPSIALIEIIILAIVAGLPLLVGGLVLAIVVKRQRDRRTQADPQPGSGTTTPRSSNSGKWFLLLGILLLGILLALPLVVVAGGMLFVIPARSVRTTQQGPAPLVQVVAMPTPVETLLVATPNYTAQPNSESDIGSVESSPPEATSLSITPDDDLLFVTLPGIAGLAVLVGVVSLAIVLKRRQGSDPRLKTVGEARGGKGSKLAAALVALAALAALSTFVILALDFSIWTFIWSVIIFAVCSIVVGLLLLVPRLLRRRQGKDSRLWDQGIVDDTGDDWAQTAKLRYALLAIAIWFALSIYLVLDVGFAVSVYWQVAAIYAAFWVLIGALLLVGSPSREKLLILGLLVVALFSIRFVDWNSRKPFLKDLYRVKQGMTVGQVEQIMGSFMGGTCSPAPPLGSPAGESAAEPEEPALPDRAVYRHTDEGWGDSDWGEIRFENGQVVEIRFLPD
jgi:hypothetical protein